MAETVDQEAANPAVADSKPERLTRPEGAGDWSDAAPGSVAGLLEQAGHDAGTIVARETQLLALRHAPELRPLISKAAIAIGLVVVLATVFALVNWAAVSALSSGLPGWRAPLVLAAAWTVIAIVLVGILLPRRLLSRTRPLSIATDAETPIRQHQQALEQAEQKMRETLEQLSDAIAHAAEEKLAAAILPLAGGMVEVGEEMVVATDDVIEAAEEIADALEDRIPGGIVINRAVDIALAPGRYGIGIAKGALARVQPASPVRRESDTGKQKSKDSAAEG